MIEWPGLSLHDYRSKSIQIKVNRKDIRWRKGDAPFFKLDFDRASRDNLGLSGVSICVRNFWKRSLLNRFRFLLVPITKLKL